MPGVLASTRLLSMTGAGGVGKTRLALRLARGLATQFADGVWLVDLAPLSVPDLVAQTIATALGVREGRLRSARDALLDICAIVSSCWSWITANTYRLPAPNRRGSAPRRTRLADSRDEP